MCKHLTQAYRLSRENLPQKIKAFCLETASVSGISKSQAWQFFDSFLFCLEYLKFMFSISQAYPGWYLAFWVFFLFLPRVCWVCVLVQPEMLANAILQVTPILSFTGHCVCLGGGGEWVPPVL